MYNGKIIAVVIPAFNEEKLIGRVIETMPDFVDKMVIVDDYSTDKTSEIIRTYQQNEPEGRIHYIRHEENRGNGAARLTGLKYITDNADIIGMMDGDAQMDPDELVKFIEPISNNDVDMTKGNRLYSGQAWHIIPKARYLGNAVLSLFTKISSGYWHIADSQSGYIAISNNLLKLLPLQSIYTDYGFPNDLLIFVNIQNGRVRDIPIRPIYNIGERSGMKIKRVIPRITWLLLRRFIRRMVEKYIVRNFHPLVFFYAFSFFLFLLDFLLTIRLVYVSIIEKNIPDINFLTVVFLTTMGFLFLLFAMWFDMDNNKNLR